MAVPVIIGVALSALIALIRNMVWVFLRWLARRTGAIIIQVAALIVAGKWKELKDYLQGELQSIEADILEEAYGYVRGFIVTYAKDKLGVDLDPNNPLSKQSLAGAIGARVGIRLSDITDREALMHDVGVAVAQRINPIFGSHFTSFWPAEELKENLQREFLVAVSNRLDGRESWLSQEVVDQIINAARGVPNAIGGAGAPIPINDKRARALYLHRLAQRKYSKKKKRQGCVWVARV